MGLVYVDVCECVGMFWFDVNSLWPNAKIRKNIYKSNVQDNSGVLQ